MLERQVTTKNGMTKTVMADNPEELDQAVRAAEAEEAKTQPDINNPEDGNKVVSPENTHTDAQGGGQVAQEPEKDNDQTEEQAETPEPADELQTDPAEFAQPKEVPETPSEGGEKLQSDEK